MSAFASSALATLDLVWSSAAGAEDDHKGREPEHASAEAQRSGPSGPSSLAARAASMWADQVRTLLAASGPVFHSMPMRAPGPAAQLSVLLRRVELQQAHSDGRILTPELVVFADLCALVERLQALVGAAPLTAPSGEVRGRHGAVLYGASLRG